MSIKHITVEKEMTTIFKEGTFEPLFIDLSSTNNILIGVIYRPPNGNYNEFITIMHVSWTK